MLCPYCSYLAMGVKLDEIKTLSSQSHQRLSGTQWPPAAGSSLPRGRARDGIFLSAQGVLQGSAGLDSPHPTPH